MTFAEFAVDYIDGTEDDVIEHLRKRYTPEPVPPCHVCGKELGIAAIGGGRPTRWACQTYVDGQLDWDHYSESRFEQCRTGDRAVLAALDELERLRAALRPIL